MIQVLVVNALFGLSYLTFSCHAPKILNQDICDKVYIEFLKTGIPQVPSIYGESDGGEIEFVVSESPSGIILENDSDLSLIITRVSIKRPLKTQESKYINAIVYSSSEVILMEPKRVSKEIIKFVNYSLDEVASSWYKSHEKKRI